MPSPLPAAPPDAPAEPVARFDSAVPAAAPPPPLPFLPRAIASLDRRRRHVWNRIDERLMRWASRSGRRASFYYAFFNRTFDREHRAVLVGRLGFEASKSGERASTSSLLRRNVHRLEKGLLMRPRRPVFALDYIEETVRFYHAARAASEGRQLGNREVRWAHDVLTAYFEATGSHPKLDPLRARFAEVTPPERHAGDGAAPEGAGIPDVWTPYPRDLSREPQVAYDDLLALSWRRRSVRWFRPDPVPRALIQKAADVAALSPSACNRQPFYFHVFDDPALLEEVARLPGGTAGFAQQFPAVVAIVGELRNYYGERDRHLVYVDASLAAMSFVYAAETLGLGTCCINWPDIERDERRADEVLRLAPDQRPVMFLAVGYPDPEGMVAYSQKKPFEEIARFNFEDSSS